MDGFKNFRQQLDAQDLDTSAGLLSLANQEGGAVAQVANELSNPKTGILSTVGRKFKTAFSEFIDVISIPNQMVAGAISDKYTVKQAMDKNISTSDVIYGKADPKASVYQKIGGFIVRTATDVLLDPTTYLTFGTGAILKTGLKTQVVLGEAAAKAWGKEAFDTAVLNTAGQDVFQYIQKIGSQHNGTTAYKHIATGNKAFDLAGEELEYALKKTIDAPLDEDFALKTVSKMLEKNPALVEEYLDKGGMKYFGQTILSAQRMKATFEMIPGMSSLDVITEQPRKAIASLFSPNYTKLNSGQWVRVPAGITQLAQKHKDLLLAKHDNKMAELNDVVGAFNLNDVEVRFLTAAVESNMIPANAKLQSAYKHMLGYGDEDWNELVKNGFLAKETRMESFVPHVGIKNKNTSVSFKMPPSISTGANKERTMAKFVNPTTGQVQTGRASELGLKRVLTSDEQDRIMEAINTTYEKTQSKIAQANKEIDQLAGMVQEIFQSKLSDTTKAILKKNPDLDMQNLKLFVQTVVNEAGDLNVEKLVKSYGTKNFEAGLKKKIALETKDMSYDALALLKARLDNAGKALPDDMVALNTYLGEALKKKPKGATKKTAKETSGEIKGLMDKLKMHHEAVSSSLINQNIDKESLANFVEGIKVAFIENPAGARKALEAIIGKKQQVTDLLSELDIAKTGAKMDLFGLPAAKAVYKNSAGDIFTKETAPIFNVKDAKMFEEIEDTLLKDPKAAAKMLDDIKQDGFEIFDDNIITAWSARTLKNLKATQMKKMLQEAAQDFGVEKQYASAGFVPISSETITKEAQNIINIMGKDGEMVFHPAIASYMEKFTSSVVSDDATMDFLKSYDKIQNFWKATVTSIFPAFHGRNAISNVLQNYLSMGVSALDPRTHTMSMQLIANQRHMGKLQREAIVGSVKAQEKIAELSTKKFFTDVTGHEWSYGEMIQVAKNHNIAFTTKVVNATDAAQGPEGIAEALFPAKTKMGKLGRAAQVPVKIGQDVVGRTLEEQARLVSFITHLKDTGDVTMAARQTKQFLFDYSNLTNFERNVLRRIMPFYTFTRKNIELQARALITTPGRIAAEVHTASTLGEIISGGESLTDAEKEKLPDWIKSGMTILTKKNGSQVNILRNLGTPLEAPFMMMQANNVLGSVSPLLRVPVELAGGYNFFAGKPLSEVTNASAFQNAPQVIKNMIGFTTITKADGEKWNVALRPATMHLILNLPPTARVWSTLNTMQSQDLTSQEKTVAGLIGTKISSLDMEEEELKKERILKRQLEDLLQDAGVVAKFSRTFIPKTEEEKAAADFAK